jgi:DNA polymerase I-like protein with 3'-5' exonuclease and polymerase domains
MAQMWRVGLPWNREELEQCRIDYEDDIKELGNEFIRELDNDLPSGKKLPRNEDGSFNLRAKDQGSVRLGTKKYAGFNIKSSKQLLEKLELVLGYTPVNNDGKPSVAKDALKNCAADSPTIQTLITWKRREKRRQMIESIQDKMSDDGFVRASYMQLGADTGRMSSIKPNNQQIPRDSEFRQCVQAPQGWKIVDADFSQMELRLAAALAKDKNMTAAFQRGEDLHDYTAEQMGCDRQIAKSANFGLLYGAGAEGLRKYAGSSGVIMSNDEAVKIRDNWLNTYSGIRDWQREMNYLSRSTEGDEWPETRVPVSNMRRFLKGDLNRTTVRCNTPIQGAGAAILKCALGNLWVKVKETGEDKVRIAAAVHDELILLVKEDLADEWAEILKTTMEKAEAKWLGDVPALAEVSIGDKWSEVH